MSTISETALEAVGRPIADKYTAVADRVLAALEAREQDIFADLVESAVGLGISRDQAFAALAGSGLTPPDEDDPDPCDEVASDLGAKIDAAVDAINSRIDNLVAKSEHAQAWARTQGYRPAGRRVRR